MIFAPDDDERIRRHYLRRLALGVALLVALAPLAAVGSLRAMQSVLNRPPHWIPPDVPARMAFEEFTQRFHGSAVLLVSWPTATLQSPQLDAAVDALRRLTDDPPPAPSHDVAENAAPLRSVVSGAQVVQKMTEAPIDLPRSVAIRRLQGGLVGPDGQQTCLVVALSEQGQALRRTLLPDIRRRISEATGTDPEDIYFVGQPLDGAVIDHSSIRSIQLFTPPSALIAAVLCFLCLRSWIMTAGILLVAVIGEGLVLAGVYWSGSPLNAILIVLPPLVFVLTVSAGIHLANYYIDASLEHPGQPRGRSAVMAMRVGTLPCWLAAGTTMVGLGSLTLVRIEPIRLFGMIAALGVLVTLLLLLLVMPGCMVLCPRGDALDASGRRTRAARLQGLWWRKLPVFRRVVQSPWGAITLFLLVALTLGVGLMRLDTTVNVPRMFSPASDFRRQYAWFEEHIGPTVNGEVLLTFDPRTGGGGALERSALIQDVHVHVARTADVGGVISTATFLPPLPRGGGLRATAQRSVIRSLIEQPDSSLAQLGYLFHDDDGDEVWRLSFALPLSETADYQTQLQRVANVVRSRVAISSLDPQLTFTGNVAVSNAAQTVLLRDLFRSFMSAFAVVGLLMVVLLRGLIGGLLAMLPNLFPTAALFGAMGWAGWPVDIGSMMTASVALGIAVDDTVHLLSRFGSRRQRGLPRRRAASGALRQCGPAMFQTTLVCGLSLLVYGLSDFLPTQRFAILMLGLLGAALLGDLLLLPAMMSSGLGHWLSKPVLVDPGAELADPETDLTDMSVAVQRIEGQFDMPAEQKPPTEGGGS